MISIYKEHAQSSAIRLLAVLILAAFPASQLAAQPGQFGQSGQSAQPGITAPTYADLADLAEAAEIVLRVEVRKQAQVKPERAPGLAPGFARLYIEARTAALISGSAPIGESLRYLVDVPLDSPNGSRGKVPKLKKQEMLLFARPVQGRPGAVQLVGPGAQMRWSEVLEQRLRPILAALLAPGSPPVITGVRDALSVQGNLAGESETQLFLDTRSGDPVSVTIARRPSQSPVWGVSWSEIVDQAARPPRPQTLEWYRLACFLPQRLPPAANLSREVQARAQAEEDYAFVIQQLGPCQRTLIR